MGYDKTFGVIGGGYSAALSRVNPQTREAFDTVLGAGFLPLSVLEDVMPEMAAEAGEPLLAFHKGTMSAVTERKLRTIWRLLLRLTSDAAIVKRAPIIWRRTFDGAEFEGAVTTPGRGTATVTGWPQMREMHLAGFAGGAEAVLRVAGRSDVRATQRRTSNGGVVEIQWSV